MAKTFNHKHPIDFQDLIENALFIWDPVKFVYER